VRIRDLAGRVNIPFRKYLEPTQIGEPDAKPVFCVIKHGKVIRITQARGIQGEIEILSSLG
jgi:hypothetical protein